MRCRDLMTSCVQTCGITDPVSECARTMSIHDIGFLPVLDASGMIRGVVTDRDLATRVLAAARGPSTRVGDVMTDLVVECAPEEELRVAEERMMMARVSRIPVVSEGRCVGVLSLSDIVRIEEPGRASQLMRLIAAREGKPPPSFA